MNLHDWPKPGDKVKFKGTHQFWFLNIIEDADRLLTPGHTYTLTKVRVYSSWVSVGLEGFDDVDFALSFFEYERNKQQTDESKTA